MDILTSTSIFVNVIFVATFLTIFFFTFVSKIERSTANEQIHYLVNDLFEDASLLPKDILFELQHKVDNIDIDTPSIVKSNKLIAERNNAIFTSTIKTISVIFIIGISIAFYISKRYGFSMSSLIKKNLIILCAIALTETSFLMAFGRNYISIDPNLVKLEILKNLTR